MPRNLEATAPPSPPATRRHRHIRRIHRNGAVLAGLLLAAAAHAAPISSLDVDPHFSYNNMDIEAGPLRNRIQVGGVTLVDAAAVVGQAVVVSLSSGALFDQIAALYTNGVPDDVTHLYSVGYVFDASIGGNPPVELGATFSVISEFAGLPDLAGYVIDEFRLTSTVTCWDGVNVPTKDTCSAPQQQSKIEMSGTLKVEFFGHLASATVPEPGSGVLAAAALLALAGVPRRRTR